MICHLSGRESPPYLYEIVRRHFLLFHGFALGHGESLHLGLRGPTTSSLALVVLNAGLGLGLGSA